MYNLYFSNGGSIGPVEGYEESLTLAEERIKGLRPKPVTVEIRPVRSLALGGFGAKNYGSTLAWVDNNGELQVKHI